MPRTHNIFEAPVLTILADPVKLQLQYTHTRLLDCSHIERSDELFPYGDFLNQCLSFDAARWQKAFDQIKRLLPGAENASDLRPGINMMRSRISTEFEQQLDRSLEFQLERLLNTPADQRNDLFSLDVDMLTKSTGEALLGRLAAAGVVPFHDVSEAVLKQAAADLEAEEFLPPVFSTVTRTVGVILHDNLDPVVNTFIWNMKKENLYLHQCSICKAWFVRTDIRKSAYCGGGYCLTQPCVTPKRRYAAKVKDVPYWRRYGTDYNFWAQRKRRGQMTPEQFKAWQRDAKSLRGKVDKGEFSPEKYMEWLMKCRNLSEKIGPDTQADFWNAEL